MWKCAGLQLGKTLNFHLQFFRTFQNLSDFTRFRASALPNILLILPHYNYQMENDKINADLLARAIDLNAKLLSSAASSYAYNKINNILLMQVLAKVEGRDLEEIRTNVDRYIAQFTDEFMKKNA